MFWLILTTLVVCGIFYFFFTPNRYEKYGIPCPSRFTALISHVWFLKKNFSMIDYVQRIYELNKEAKYAGFTTFFWPVILIRDLDLIKSITVKDFDHFANHSGNPDFDLEPLFTKNLTALRGEEWRKVRALLSPAFTSSKMKALFHLMNECADTFVNHLVERSTKQPIDVDAKDIFSRYANDTIATCAFGISVDSMRDPNNQFYVLGRKATDFTKTNMMLFLVAQACPWLFKLLKLKITPPDAEEFFFNLVRETIATRDEKGIVRQDMLQLMMDTRGNESDSKNPELSIECMTAQAFIFFLGGFDSTSNLMCFLTHVIADNPEVQQKLEQEIDETLQKNDGNLTYDAVHNMTYLDAVISETLRIYAPGPWIDRECTKAFELPPAVPGAKPFVVPVGLNVWLPLWAIHRDPKYFSDPEKFIPERFLGDMKESFNSAAYFPFGFGPRMCIANRFALMETKVLIVNLFSRCRAKISKKMAMPLKIMARSFQVTADGGFWLEIEPRNKIN